MCLTTYTCICGQSHSWWHEHEHLGAPDRAHIIDADPERDTSRCTVCGQVGTYHRLPVLPCSGGEGQ